jgi:hypothetical protein
MTTPTTGLALPEDVTALAALVRHKHNEFELLVAVTQVPPPATGACPHRPPCPAPNAIDHTAARVVAAHPEQGWSLLCNGVITFDDTGELLPDGQATDPHRGPAQHTVTATVGGGRP